MEKRRRLILSKSEEDLFSYLGEVDFQLERYGNYNSSRIFEIRFGDRGRKVFQKYVRIIKSKVCPLYENLKESGVLDTTEKVYLFILGVLIASNVYWAIAVGAAAIVAKQGLYSFCKEIRE